MSSDPFIIVKEDVEQAMEQASETMEDWSRLRRQMNYKERISVFDVPASQQNIEQQTNTHHMIVDFAAQQQQQQIILEQQDEHMDSILGTVRNLRGIAHTMNNELDDHAVLLDEVNEMVDNTQNRLNNARNQVGNFLRRSQENHPIKVILILVLLILLMIALIIMT
ncbi:hypothetical protein BB558_006375 [Smittium angustum]|uniref:t-SNARE coiled-coil homology domain-containing protein n=1 Tax=Smittium angustum TaxID=133377 RepID=A0A2U1IXW4_SMIAN|nr:hypothetical protein BB558_006375 [Smittium angustum]